MAVTSTNHAALPANPLRALGEAILGTLVRIAENNSRLREAERLNALTDDQLAARGLKREEIARHVFRDMYYV